MPKKFSKKLRTSFREKVYKIVKKIPKGKTLSYKTVAKLASRPGAWRVVGNILNKNKNLHPHTKFWCGGKQIPCHRVIRSDGKIGGYKGGTKKKIYLLKKEI